MQPVPGGDDYGLNDANEEPNRQEAERGTSCSKSSSIASRPCDSEFGDAGPDACPATNRSHRFEDLEAKLPTNGRRPQ